MKMRKPNYAVAMEQLEADKELNEKFKALPDIKKWKWLAFACENLPYMSIEYAREMVRATIPV